MTSLVRQEVIQAARRVVVKVGTRVLTHENGRLDQARIAELSRQLGGLAQDREVVLVSSGAVGAGMSELGHTERPRDLAQLQAVAAIGQTHLIQHYDRNLQTHGLRAAQVLLTAEDLNHRGRYLNCRNTLVALLQHGAVPIINENDTVAVDELMMTFGDNDHLAAVVTNLLRAQLLVILSDVDGLYDGDPDLPDSRILETVTSLGPDVHQLARSHRPGLSKGGMSSKLRAAEMVTQSGENVIIASGRRENVLLDLFAGAELGTLFLAQGKNISPRKRWLAFSARPVGTIVVDEGASAALIHNGRSLLAIGVLSCQGEFEKGDVVSVVDAKGRELARGLCNYHHLELQRIKGLNSRKFAQVLGHAPYEEVIHRDNLSVLKPPESS